MVAQRIERNYSYTIADKSNLRNNMVRLVLTAILLILVTACGSIGLLPTNDLVQKAIALGLEQTQQKLSQQLDLDFQGFEIKRLSITQEQPLTIENLPAFHVKGSYDLIIKLPKRRLTQPQKPFDVYLQIQQEGKTWRLLIPDKASKNTQSIWRSYLIQ
jgi:predicted XRE-type DNA-binding protein